MIKKWIADHPNLWEFVLFNILSNVATITNFAVMWIGTGFVFASLSHTMEPDMDLAAPSLMKRSDTSLRICRKLESGDKNQSPIVRRIFRKTLEGYGPYPIAAQFTAEHIPIPAYHQALPGVGLWQNREMKCPYKWTSSTIAHILQIQRE